ncbi:MAG: 4Fe-4S dicluster domain-containing protein [Elusimicrobia bacterium]|nr:4Fe-4S dicluster domain-containing protein [Elusimicrobiota bacterium]
MSYKRYHIETKTAPLENAQIFKTIVNRADFCINCGICQTACPYDVHERNPDYRSIKGSGVRGQGSEKENTSSFVPHPSPLTPHPFSWIDLPQMASPKNANCTTCFHCVNECPVGALSLAANPDYKTHGDDYYQTQKVEAILFEAKTGRVPVSGAGYRGPFAGKGFDGIWTDMSEIVRPTRDGIHGREWISTAVYLGRRPKRLALNGKTQAAPRCRELGVPIIFNQAPPPVNDPELTAILLEAAQAVGTLAIVEGTSWPAGWASPPAIPSFNEKTWLRAPETNPGLLELDFCDIYPEDWLGLLKEAKTRWPQTIIIIKVPLDPKLAYSLVRFAEEGVDAIHLAATPQGTTKEGEHLTSTVKTIDETLVDHGIRDEISIIVSGGIAAADHLPKLILCGADMVAIDVACLIALGITKFSTERGALKLQGPLMIPPKTLGVQRIKNLVGSWRDQLLEILGAMGMRDVVRITGDTGRMMLHEDLDKEFRALFPKPPNNWDPTYG